jgi:hypothetical protein
MAHYLDNHSVETLTNKLNTLTTPQLVKALNDLSPTEALNRETMTSNNEMGQMDQLFTWSSMDRLISRTDQAIAGLVAKLAAFKHSFNQLLTSRLHHKTTAFAINQDPDPKHLPGSARIALGKSTLWVQGTASRFSQDNIADPAGLSVQGLDGNTADTSIGWDYALPLILKPALPWVMAITTIK